MSTPVRTCVGCRRTLPQPALVRVVRLADGQVVADPPRRRRGRGAYLCSPECVAPALRGALARAFRKPIRADAATLEAATAGALAARGPASSASSSRGESCRDVKR